MTELQIIEPNLQIKFHYKLREIKEKYLSDALKKTIGDLHISEIDGELNRYASTSSLKKLAGYGLRGEVWFPVPSIIRHNPYLIGYYRLLYGFSKKELYSKRKMGGFKTLEENGVIPENKASEIEGLCKCLIGAGELLLNSLDSCSLEIIKELQILTIGPQFRGGQNTIIGQEVIQSIFKYLGSLVEPYLLSTTDSVIIFKNNSDRTIIIEFSNDPDIKFTEHVGDEVIPLLVIEIKGGEDISNIHNRIGEAEKSHEKAKKDGFTNRWTIIRVIIDYAELRNESTNTTKFFHLDRIQDPTNPEYIAFRNNLSSILNITL